MNKSEIGNNGQIRKTDPFPFQPLSFTRLKLRREMKELERSALETKEGSEAKIWLTENLPFIKKALRSLDPKRVFASEKLQMKIGSFLSSPGLQSFGRQEAIRFCEEIDFPVKEKEVRSIREVFLLLSFRMICRSAFEDPAKIPLAVTRFRQAVKIDPTLFSVLSPVDKTLRKNDPDYPQMTRKTQLMYRKAIERLAIRKKKPEEEIVSSLLKEAKEKKVTPGEILFPRRKNPFYFPVLFLLFFFLFFLFGWKTESVFLCAVFAVPLYFFCRSLIDLIFSSFVRQTPFLSMKVDQVTEKEKTLVVIPALIRKREDVKRLAERLLRFQINNSDVSDQIFYGLVCDFKESSEKNDPGDPEILSAVRDEIASLNRKRDLFFAYLRPREYAPADGVFRGYERKRGALEELISFSAGEKRKKDRLVFGGEEKICFARSLICLDEDTDLSIGQAKRLLGIHLHPCNRVRIGSRNGKKKIVSGYGILQPRMASSLLERVETRFGKILANGSGEDPYPSVSFERMQSLFGVGNFCGKGLIDIAAYRELLTGAFPEGKILSHDLPEGSILGCAYVSEEQFCDSTPQDVISFYKRKHRWIRGDVQNLAVFSLLTPLHRYLLIENLFSYLRPLFELVLLFAAPFFGFFHGVAAALLILFFHFEEVLLSAVRILFSGNAQHFSRRFATRIRNLLLNAVYRGLFSLSGLAFEAYYQSDALFRALYRLLISKKKLLEWQTFSSLSSKFSLFFFLPSVLIGAILLFLCRNYICLIFCIGFLFFLPVSLFLSVPYREKKRIPDRVLFYYQKLFQETFSFFESFVNENTSFLPPDNIQFSPVEKIALRTSPTNIGLYLTSLVCARDLGRIGENEFQKRLEKALDSLEKMEKYRGNLYNWYELATLQVIGDRMVSSVDSGNYLASLILVRQALFENPEKRLKFQPCLARIDRLIDETDLAALFDREEGLFFVSVFPDRERQDPVHYDLYMSEARLCSFLSIALGKIPPEHWYRLGRPLFSHWGRVGAGSWSGTAFEYFLPPLFLPVIDNSFEDESLDFALYAQKKYAEKIVLKKGPVGIGESGYAVTDAAGNYQYRAFGVPYLSLREEEGAAVFSPYSALLMAPFDPQGIQKALLQYEKTGARGRFGFFESVDFQKGVENDPEIVQSVMSHHTGMILMALHRVFFPEKNPKRFLSYREFEAKKELLAERFPLEQKVFSRPKGSLRKAEKDPHQAEIKPESQDSGSGYLLSDGNTSFLLLHNGEMRFFHEKRCLFSPLQTPQISVLLSGAEYDILENEKTKIDQTDTFLNACLKEKTLQIQETFFLIPGKKTLGVRLEVNGFSGNGVWKWKLPLALCEEAQYLSHPAFEALSLEAEKDDLLTVYKRSKEGVGCRMRIFSDLPASFSGCNGEIKEGIKIPLSDGDLFLNVPFSARASVHATLLFSFSEEGEAILPERFLDPEGYPKKDVQNRARAISEHLKRLSFYGEETPLWERKLLFDLHRPDPVYLGDGPEEIQKDRIWRYGISGDLVILSVNLENEASASKILSAAKKLYLSSFRFDLVFLYRSKPGYFSPLQEKAASWIRKMDLEFLLGKSGGIHFIACADEKEEKEIRLFSRASYFFSDPIPSLSEKRSRIPPAVREKATISSQIGVFSEGSYSFSPSVLPQGIAFSHVLSNRVTGFVCNQTSLGYTWFLNAALNRVSRWDSLYEKGDGEKIYLFRDGVFTDLLAAAERVTYRRDLVLYEGKTGETDYRVIAFPSEQTAGKNILLFCSGKIPEDAELVFSFVPVCGRFASSPILLEKKTHLYALRRLPSGDLKGGGYVFAPGCREVKRNRDRVEFYLPLKEENHLALGGYSGKEHFDYLESVFSSLSPKNLYEEERRRMDPFYPHRFSDQKEFWLWHQTLASRFFGRTGAFQSGGAYGFRDQIQDSLLFLESDPDLSKRHLLRCASHQFSEGDVQHWWHPGVTGKGVSPGVRTLCADDYVWLLFVSGEYFRATFDRSLMDIPVSFLSAPPLAPGEKASYFVPEKGDTAPFSEHLDRAAALFLSRPRGKRGFPLFGTGDWNDGMNEIDGESVWLGEFGAIALNRYCEFSENEELKEKCQKEIKALEKAVAASFNGSWFARGYWTNGDAIGSDLSLEKECSIDLLPQAFAAFLFCESDSAYLEETMIDSALKSVYEILLDPSGHTLSLFTPPFTKSSPSPGYIQKYCGGLRENGGQYTHAAVWYGLSLLRFYQKTKRDEYRKMVREVLRILDPFSGNDRKRFLQYQREPYVMCGDVSTANGMKGRGGWSWYTGSAAWYARFRKETEKMEKQP